MPATDSLCYIAGLDPCYFSPEENLIIEVELFARICEELKNIFREKLKDYFRLVKINTFMEEEMLDAKLIYCVVNDILASEEYSLLGIANYTHTPEDVIYDIALGQNTNPSLNTSRKIIELHRRVRPDLYNSIMRKIAQKYEEVTSGIMV